VEHLHGKHGSGKDGGDAREQKVVGAIQFRGPVENFTQVKGRSWLVMCPRAGAVIGVNPAAGSRRPHAPVPVRRRQPVRW